MAEDKKEAAKKEPTKPYRYKGPGKHHLTQEGSTETITVKEGDIVQLTARQARAFEDRFEEVGEK